MDWNILVDNYDKLLAGAWTTLWTITLSLVIGLFLALATAVMSTSKNGWLKWPAETFSYIFRGTPMLIQLYIFYYGVRLLIGSIEGIENSVWFDIIRMSWVWAVIAMTLNTAAYTCEIIRGGIQNTPSGEIEAAKALGMSNARMLWRIVLPSAMRRSLPAYGNEVIYMLHGSAVLSWVAVTDLTGAALLLRDEYYDPYVPFIGAAAIYLAITACIALSFKLLEKKYLSYLSR